MRAMVIVAEEVMTVEGPVALYTAVSVTSDVPQAYRRRPLVKAEARVPGVVFSPLGDEMELGYVWEIL